LPKGSLTERKTGGEAWPRSPFTENKQKEKKAIRSRERKSNGLLSGENCEKKKKSTILSPGGRKAHQRHSDEKALKKKGGGGGVTYTPHLPGGGGEKRRGGKREMGSKKGGKGFTPGRVEGGLLLSRIIREGMLVQKKKPVEKRRGRPPTLLH